MFESRLSRFRDKLATFEAVPTQTVAATVCSKEATPKLKRALASSTSISDLIQLEDQDEAEAVKSLTRKLEGVRKRHCADHSNDRFLENMHFMIAQNLLPKVTDHPKQNAADNKSFDCFLASKGFYGDVLVMERELLSHD